MSVLALCGAVLSARAHGDLHEQIEQLSTQIAASPGNGNLYLKRANLHRQHREWSSALNDLKRARELGIGVEVTYFEGLVLFESGSLAEARRRFDEVIASEPQHFQALLHRARTIARAENARSALPDYTRGLSLLAKPTPDLLAEVARTYASAGQPEKALRLLDDGMQAIGHTPALQLCAIGIARESGDTDEALRRLATLKKGRGLQARWKSLEGEILLQAGRSAEARAAFQSALEELNSLPLAQRASWAPVQEKLRKHLDRLESSNVKKSSHEN